MALTISFMKGEGFWVIGKPGHRDERFEIVEVFLSKGFVVRSDEGREFRVTPEDEVEVTEGVWLADGHRNILGRARCVFEAPKSIKILRDDLYREFGAEGRQVSAAGGRK